MDPEPQVGLIVIVVSHPERDWPLGAVDVAATISDGSGERIVATARTADDGRAALEITDEEWHRRVRREDLDGLVVRVHQGAGASLADDAERPGDSEASAQRLTAAMAAGDDPVHLTVSPSQAVGSGVRSLVANALVTSRRVRLSEVAADLAAPRSDSLLGIVAPADRVRLLDDLFVAAQHEPAAPGLDDRFDLAVSDDPRIVDPEALRGGNVIVEAPPVLAVGERARFDLDRLVPDRSIDQIQPIWERYPWARPDDQSYRDYLRGVFVLFAHQQRSGSRADPTEFPDLVERQLTRRFFQDFTTTDRSETPLNRLVALIVREILISSTGSGFGFGLPTASLPSPDGLTDREYLDALIELAPVKVRELANRYRLPLREPDSTMSSPVLLNIHTLSHVLSDTAQGPVEPTENVVDPQLPGAQRRPILWRDVVGSAPFFLRFDEWLLLQRPFFPENLFAIRTQVFGATHGVWLDEARKRFLDHHASRPSNQWSKRYEPYFGSMSEVHRSAKFLLKYGAADAKLTELVRAIDRNQFETASRLAAEADELLRSATPPKWPAGEDWEPEFESGNFARPLSFSRRRRLRVRTISQLTGDQGVYPPNGFERFFQLPRPTDLWGDIVHFRNARDTATRLRTYQERFVLPMLRAMIRTGLGDVPAAIDVLQRVTGFYIGTGFLGSPAGMTRHPDAGQAKRAVNGRIRWSDPIGDRPYTARLLYDDDRRLLEPFPLTPQVRNGYDVTSPEPSILHPLEERYARIAQADALLAWAESLYRTDDPSNLERARELYKAVVFLHGGDPGTSAYRPAVFSELWPSHNPRVRNQLDRAALALTQLEAGLNFYGYSYETVPTLRYQTLVGASRRWSAGAKSAQNDYLAYLGRVEQADLDVLAATAQERKARAAVAIAAEQMEVAMAGVVVAQRLVADVEKLIDQKRKEIEDANSIFSQFKDYFSGMKSSISSLVDVGKGAAEGSTALGLTTDAEIKATTKSLGSQAASGAGVGGGLAVLGGFAAFAVLSTMTLQGMADAATKRDGELKALRTEALPAARAAVRVQERLVTIAELQAEIAESDHTYARDLVAYQSERFLNRDFWEALAGVARRSLRRYLDLAGQAAWFAERALAYQLGSPLRIVRLGYFDPVMRDVGGVDRLGLDLAELEAVRLGAARVTVPITRTYSLARDLPLAFGELKRSGRCTFALSDDDLEASYPGTFAHRIRAVDVSVEAPGTLVRPRGMLTNQGFSLLRRLPGADRVPLLRFTDAYPLSEHRLRDDLGGHDLAKEQLSAFEGSAFTTTWTLELPSAGNPAGLARVTDVLLTFAVHAGYDGRAVAPQPAAVESRSLFVSALSVDTAGLGSLRTTAPAAQLRFALGALAVPTTATITNLAVIVPGVDTGRFDAALKVGPDPAVVFSIEDGIAMSNLGVLSDGDPTNALPLNAAAGGSPAQTVELEITKGTDAALLASARDLLLWLEFDVPA